MLAVSFGQLLELQPGLGRGWEPKPTCSGTQASLHGAFVVAVGCCDQVTDLADACKAALELWLI